MSLNKKLRVDHNLADLKANQDYIMTVKDAGVLDSSDEADDEIQLENTEL